MNLTVRPATPADVPAMMSIARHAATASQWSMRKYQSVFDVEIPKRIALVIEKNVSAEDNAAIEGFLIAQCVSTEWEIENVAVAGPARRRGLGTRLLLEFLNLARRNGAESVFLEVRPSNTAARNLYEKWAFVESARRSGYYQTPPEDALVYRLQLR